MFKRKMFLSILGCLIVFYFFACSNESPIIYIDGGPAAEYDTTYIRSVINEIQMDTMLESLRVLTGDTTYLFQGEETRITTRHLEHNGNDVAAEYIKSRFEEFGLEVSEQQYSGTGRNILGTLWGEEGNNSLFIISAHYDCCSSLYCDPDISAIAPGADDNGTGVSTVIEAARILSQYSPKTTIVFALWDEEETGLHGSDYYAALAYVNNLSIEGVINIDMIGWDGDNDSKISLAVSNTNALPALALRTRLLSEMFNIGVYISFEDIIRSDHNSFWNFNFRAVSFTEYYQDFNPYYHTREDIIDNLDKDYWLRVSKLAIALLTYYTVY